MPPLRAARLALPEAGPKSRQPEVATRAAAESGETPRRTSTGYMVTIRSIARPEAEGMKMFMIWPTM